MFLNMESFRYKITVWDLGVLFTDAKHLFLTKVLLARCAVKMSYCSVESFKNVKIVFVE